MVEGRKIYAYHYYYHYHYGIKPASKPASLGAKTKANGYKLVAMARDIRYLGVRVGEACGPQTAPTAAVEGRKSYAYHTYHYGNNLVPIGFELPKIGQA